MKPARPVGAHRGELAPLRLVGATEASAPVLLEQARTAEERSRHDLARELYERALPRARGANEAYIVPVALLASARLASAAGESTVALDILEVAIASASVRNPDVDCARAGSLRARVFWEAGDLVAAEREAVRARDWASRASDTREASAALRMLAALAVARGAL